MPVNKGAVAVGAIAVIGLLTFALTRKAEAGGHPKFKVGDYIIGKTHYPQEAVWKILDYTPGPAPNYGLYTVAQWFGGGLINQQEWSVELTDRTMELWENI